MTRVANSTIQTWDDTLHICLITFEYNSSKTISTMKNYSNAIEAAGGVSPI